MQEHWYLLWRFNANVNNVLTHNEKIICLGNALLNSMVCWLLGLLFCVMAFGSTYLCQQFYLHGFSKNAESYRHAVLSTTSYTMPVDRKAVVFQRLSVGLMILSYLALLVSGIICYSGFSLFLQ